MQRIARDNCFQILGKLLGRWNASETPILFWDFDQDDLDGLRRNAVVHEDLGYSLDNGLLGLGVAAWPEIYVYGWHDFLPTGWVGTDIRAWLSHNLNISLAFSTDGHRPVA